MTQFTITELTRLHGLLSQLELYGQKIVWSSKDNEGSKIFLYSKNKIVEIKNTNGAFPEISGRNMVWSAKDSDGDQEIFFNDGEETIQLTDNNVDDTSPQISGDNIVWNSNSFYAFRKIYVGEIWFDNGEDIIQINNNSHFNTLPVMSGNKVAWAGTDSDGNRSIFYYNGKKTIKIPNIERESVSSSKTFNKVLAFNNNYYNNVKPSVYNTTVKLVALPCYLGTNDPTCDLDKRDNYSPRISDNNVAWEIDGNLFFYDGKHTVQLDDLDRRVHGLSVQISENNVVWTAEDPDGDQEIFFNDGEETSQLTDNDVNDYSPQISDNNIVWISGDNALSREIFFYNGEQIIQLTNNHELFEVSPKIDWNPKIVENNIVWQRKNLIENTTSVMLATINDTEYSSNVLSDRNYQIITSSTIIILCLIFLGWRKNCKSNVK